MTRKFTRSEQTVLDVIDGRANAELLSVRESRFRYKKRFVNAIANLTRDEVLILGRDSVLRRNLAFGMPNGGMKEAANA